MGSELRECCNESLQDSESTEEVMVAFGFSGWEGDTGSEAQDNVSIQKKLELGKRLSKSFKLREIAEQAGRLKRLREGLGINKRKSNDPEASELISKVHFGNRLDLLPMNELIYMADDDLFLIFMQKFSEGRLLQCTWESRREMVEGPAIVCLDGSGSMEGEREIWAKAVALNVAMVANKNKRDFMLIHFSCSVRRTDIFSAESMNSEFRSRLLTSIGYVPNGSTNFEAPLEAAIKCIRESQNFQKADIIFITDGEQNISAIFLEKFKAQREELRFTVYGIAVEISPPPVMSLFCDQVVSINNLAEDTEAVKILASL